MWTEYGLSSTGAAFSAGIGTALGMQDIESDFRSFDEEFVIKVEQ
jgi:hypothetical protein